MSIDIRTISDAEANAFREAVMATFGGDLEEDPTGDERLRALVDRSQTWAAFDGGTIVGTAATFNLVLGVPGGTLDMPGLTMVTVRPSHRRRGIMRELIGRHLADARSRGAAISGLWASETTIYGRFGYGIAAEGDAIRIDHAHELSGGLRS
jgi:predicted N-acetyltransferase YhbS